jgi:hypothetical protein
MPNNSGMFDWTPFYQELAEKLLPFRSKQKNLIAYIESLRTKGIKVSALQDRDEAGNRFLLSEIDPFTFYGNFNRGTKTETRVAILKAIKTEFNIAAAVPADFSGIPVLNNMKAWFFSSSPYRKTEDVGRLWDVFEAALQPNPLQSEAFGKAFDAALEVRNTNLNLTMGLFWIRPYTFLSLDSNNQQFLGIQIPSDGLSFAFNKEALAKVRAKYSEDFPHLSRNAWVANNEPVTAGAGHGAAPAHVNPGIGYWLVGAYWDDQESPDQTDRFLSEGIWENGYTDRYLDQVKQIKVGDRIAIKSMFTQKHDLPFDNKGRTVSGMWIKATGTVVKNPGDGRTVEVEWDEKPKDARAWYFYASQNIPVPSIFSPASPFAFFLHEGSVTVPESVKTDSIGNPKLRIPVIVFSVFDDFDFESQQQRAKIVFHDSISNPRRSVLRAKHKRFWIAAHWRNLLGQSTNQRRRQSKHSRALALGAAYPTMPRAVSNHDDTDTQVQGGRSSDSSH